MSPLARIASRPRRNVGSADLVMRAVASVVLAGLIAVVLLHMYVAFAAIKISLLAAAELGLVTLMLGLFLDTKTHCAGLQLLVASLLMYVFTRQQLPWAAVTVGVVFLSAGLSSLTTRRSRFNQLFNLCSLREGGRAQAASPGAWP